MHYFENLINGQDTEVENLINGQDTEVENVRTMLTSGNYSFIDIYKDLIPRFASKQDMNQDTLKSKYNAINRVNNPQFWALIRAGEGNEDDNSESGKYTGLSIVINHSVGKDLCPISYCDVKERLGEEVLVKKSDIKELLNSSVGEEKGEDINLLNSAVVEGKDEGINLLDSAVVKEVLNGITYDKEKISDPIKFLRETEDGKHCLITISLSVGTGDYGADASLARRPGTRRKFAELLKYKDRYICAGIKRNLLDNESDIFEAKAKNLAKVVGVESKNETVLAYFVVDILDENGQWLVYKFFQAYAKIRGWKLRKNSDSEIDDCCFGPTASGKNNESGEKDETIVKNLLMNRRFVVLQGAPGTGKTRLAKNIANELCGKNNENNEKNENIIFTQFHAETSYADFVSGIFPRLNSDTNNNSELGFEEREGALVKAIRKAIEKKNKNEKVVLIIDEINRANLANVLGEAFYLFEPGLTDDAQNPEVKLTSTLSLRSLPDNLYVIATMNTADRSLAVVDFALRRRFAWYSMVPHKITVDNNDKFFEEEFNELSELFDEYATDDELNLKPGHAYFIVNKKENEEEIFKDRLRYEVMPLIKEYLSEGMLLEGADAFEEYFRKHIGEGMFY